MNKSPFAGQADGVKHIEELNVRYKRINFRTT